MNVKRTLFACGVALALLLAVSTQGAHALKWKLCEGDWEAKIVNATVLPDPARAADEINVIINGEIGECVPARSSGPRPLSRHTHSDNGRVTLFPSASDWD